MDSRLIGIKFVFNPALATKAKLLEYLNTLPVGSGTSYRNGIIQIIIIKRAEGVIEEVDVTSIADIVFICETDNDKVNIDTRSRVKIYPQIAECEDYVCVLRQYGKTTNSIWGIIPLEVGLISCLPFLQNDFI